MGVDCCYECIGVPELLNEAIEGSKVGLGTIVFIGSGLHLSGELKYIQFLCGRTIKGSIYGGTGNTKARPNENESRMTPCILALLSVDGRFPMTFAIIRQMNGGSSAKGIAGDENGTLVTGECLETECFGKAVEG
ncbi:alcohol dehydrogenase [Olea europaea subsp. europaea]|uniref:Alcohol dehydrogenase, partial n=1 Tax=Olea europaea subsp. europaea TaxID=158383 RepID=A0A8S0RVU0_OLEEU|nr:alcohol dehydrogenase [Olea europaea subsp. europaea]